MGAVNFLTSFIPGRKGGAALDEPAPPEAVPTSPLAAWGLSLEHMGAAYDAREIYSGERALNLDYRSKFYYARLHDSKAFDMNGLPVTGTSAPGTPGFPGGQGYLASSGDPRWVPYANRRPNAPYRLARSMVKAFTAMLWGDNRWPTIRSDDPDTQAFCEAIVKAANLKNRYTRARNVGGACGTSMLSWLFRAGKPVVHLHSGRFCQVLEWDDIDTFVPRHVTELYRTFASRVNEEGQSQRYEVWQRHDWTLDADIVFKPVEVTPDNPVEWFIDEARSFRHGDGECHCVWIPNFPDDEDPGAIDGQPDYAECYEQLETLDISNSILVQGVNKNLDPTLVVKRENPNDVKVIKKGSENAIVVDPSGGAAYLTIPSDVVTTGETLIELHRRQLLEVAQCVIADPEKIAAAGTSSLTMKLVYAPMIGATDLLREPYGDSLVRLLEQMQRSAARSMSGETPEQPGEMPEPEPDVEDESMSDEGAEEALVFEPEELPPNEQEPERVDYFLDLPSRVISEDVLDTDGKPTGEVTTKQVSIKPGQGKIELTWGEYFPATSDDKQKQLTTLGTSTGGRAVVSQRTAVETSASLLGKDSTEEWQRVRDEAADSRVDMMGAGGQVDDENAPPDGIEPQATQDANETVDNVQETVFNGAQVTSLVEVVMSVAANKLPRDAALGIIQLAFNVSLETAQKVLGAPLATENDVKPLPDA